MKQLRHFIFTLLENIFKINFFHRKKDSSSIVARKLNVHPIRSNDTDKMIFEMKNILVNEL